MSVWRVPPDENPLGAQLAYFLEEGSPDAVTDVANEMVEQVKKMETLCRELAQLELHGGGNGVDQVLISGGFIREIVSRAQDALGWIAEDVSR